MRIGLFTNNYRPLANGLATAVWTTAQALRQAGHEVAVVAPRYGGEPPEAGCLRVPGLRAPTHHAYVLPAPWWPGTARAVRQLDLDIFHAQHPFLLGAAAARWARRAGRPLVFTYHTHYERYGHYCPGPGRLAGRLALRRALRFANRADLVVAPAPGVARMLRARGVRAPVAVVPTGVPPLPPAEPGAWRAHRAALGLPADRPLCLSVGRLAPEKNQAFLLGAFARVLAAVPQARLVLLGDGDDRPRLAGLAGRLGLAGRVQFLGEVPHAATAAYYRAADLFLFASTSETQGLVVLEAMAAGLPVVAVRAEAAEDLLGRDEAGVLTAESEAAYARAVVELWQAPERRRRLAGRAREVAARFTPERCATALLACYAQARGARPRATALAATEPG
ncbi:MAG: glycosyltransferase [Candidatus Methylomirabilales bacterium]